MEYNSQYIVFESTPELIMVSEGHDGQDPQVIIMQDKLIPSQVTVFKRMGKRIPGKKMYYMDTPMGTLEGYLFMWEDLSAIQKSKYTHLLDFAKVFGSYMADGEIDIKPEDVYSASYMEYDGEKQIEYEDDKQHFIITCNMEHDSCKIEYDEGGRWTSYKFKDRPPICKYADMHCIAEYAGVKLPGNLVSNALSYIFS